MNMLQKIEKFVVFEPSLHTSYLVKSLYSNGSHEGLHPIVFNKNQLHVERINKLHNQMYKQSKNGSQRLTAGQIKAIEREYNGLSEVEKNMLEQYGIPEYSPFALPNSHCIENPLTINNIAVKEHIEKIKELDNTKIAAGIFLDTMLEDWWLELFEGRIVNAHSAILPHARGMHAIEQIAALHDESMLIKCAGASLHYIDKEVDQGKLILVKPINEDKLWRLNNLWHLKSESFLLCFELLANYLKQEDAFNKDDGVDYEEEFGPNFRARNFTLEVKEKAFKAFLEMKITKQVIELLKSTAVNFELLEHPAEGECKAVSELRGNHPHEAAKALLLELCFDKRKEYVLSLLPGDCQLNKELLVSHYRCKSVQLAKSEQTQALLGCQVGGVTPFSFNPEVKVIVDSALVNDNESIYYSHGRLDQSIKMRAKDYEAIINTGDNVFSFSKPMVSYNPQAMFSTAQRVNNSIDQAALAEPGLGTSSSVSLHPTGGQ